MAPSPLRPVVFLNSNKFQTCKALLQLEAARTVNKPSATMDSQPVCNTSSNSDPPVLSTQTSCSTVEMLYREWQNIPGEDLPGASHQSSPDSVTTGRIEGVMNTSVSMERFWIVGTSTTNPSRRTALYSKRV